MERKVLDIPREDQKNQSFYSIYFPQSPAPQQRLAPKPCSSPSPHLHSQNLFWRRLLWAAKTKRVPRGVKRSQNPKDPERPPAPCLGKDITDSRGVRESSPS